MDGAELQNSDRAGRVPTPGAACYARLIAPARRAGSGRWRRVALLAAFMPVSFVLAQCGKAPGAGQLAANSQATVGDSFDERFPRPQFKDRFPTASESLRELRPAAGRVALEELPDDGARGDRTGSAEGLADDEGVAGAMSFPTAAGLTFRNPIPEVC